MRKEEEERIHWGQPTLEVDITPINGSSQCSGLVVILTPLMPLG